MDGRSVIVKEEDIFEPRHEKTCFLPYANNKDADQRSLISVFVIRCLDK